MIIIMKRRIINEMLTTYLPTLLILMIVYVTSFYKHFFLEAIVTVNLTALLVLTTLFISVSGKIRIGEVIEFCYFTKGKVQALFPNLS